MTIFCVGGVSGSGKTTLINQHHSLQPLQLYDVSDYYAAAEDYGRHIGWQQAFELLLEDVHNYLQRNPNGDVVLEAFFRPDGKQREM
jgi:excinuclease UvrABC ATPase subunit